MSSCQWCGDVHPEDAGTCWAFDNVFERDEVMVYIELGVRVWGRWYDRGQVLVTHAAS